MQEANVVDITPFLAKHQLPLKYQYLSEQFFIPLAHDILSAKMTGQPMLVAINGCQGSGKTTLADFLVTWVNSNTEFNSVSLSIDDFYLSRDARNELAKDVHPLFASRGVPGTHDTQLMEQTLSALLAGKVGVPLPQFDKLTDDPMPKDQWSSNQKPIDIVFFEGWCVASTPQQPYQLQAPVNELEQLEDADGIWRRCVNSCLANEYQNVFAMADYTIMLKAPSFEDVYAWRLEQEHKLIAKKGQGQGTFDEVSLKRFISHFERITRENLATLAHSVDALLLLDTDRDITKMELLADQIAQPLIFTDLDGTLLDHDSYECEVIKPFLAKLNDTGVNVIFNTSKTFAEVTDIQKGLDHHQPFIVENGAAVYIPKDYFKVKPIGCDEYKGYWRFAMTQSTDKLHEDLKQYAIQFSHCVRLFSQFSAQEIAELTGLPVDKSELALQRQYSDPVCFSGSDEEKQGLIDAMSQAGYEVLVGGRFIHLTKGNNKGLAQKWLLNQFKKAYRNPFTVIALGDSQNDVAMLKAADTAILINNPGSQVQSQILQKAWQLSEKPAPAGWVQEVSALTIIKARFAAKQEQSHG
ncbi:HAD-IIB family hydrolase [Pseudoalteromonas shioyasakiensis]|uniref:HAD-IIB family hydrolase n=1 Tax=Pseudoalteromonas shioyasakiensis TaxID=1190813 RepID=UPI001EFDAA21|nr:HAD-IIB family hydrolase [Pseudoalteromonas shioyasakiensis]MCG9734729.1 HAD-IIB family hydrolase [Pseudoalteromonas shioyasakiensis]